MALRNQGMAGTAATAASGQGGMDQVLGPMSHGMSSYNQAMNGAGMGGNDFQNSPDWNLGGQFETQSKAPQGAFNPQASPRMPQNQGGNQMGGMGGTGPPGQMNRPMMGGPNAQYQRPPFNQMSPTQLKMMQMAGSAGGRMNPGSAAGVAAADQYSQPYPAQMLATQADRARAASLSQGGMAPGNLHQNPQGAYLQRAASQGIPPNFSPNAAGVMMPPSPMNSGVVTPPIGNAPSQNPGMGQGQGPGPGPGPLSQYPGVVYQSLNQGPPLNPNPNPNQPVYRPGMKGPGGAAPGGPGTNYGPMSPPMGPPAPMGAPAQGQPGPMSPAMQGSALRRPGATMLPPNSMPRPPHVTPGSCVMKLTHFSDSFFRRPESNPIDFWKALVSEFFAPNGVMKYALWNSVFDENRTFELNTPLIARFYKINFDSEVRHIHMLMGNPKEYLLSNGLVLVDCPRAELTYVFDDELRVVALGHLRVTFLQNLKIQIWEFHTKKHYEMLPRSLLTTYRTENESQEDLHDDRTKVMIPGSFLNEFGITVQTMRCLEIAEVVCHMRELMNFSDVRQLGPIASLQQYYVKGMEYLRTQGQQQYVGTPGNTGNYHLQTQSQSNTQTPGSSITSPGYATPGSFMGGGGFNFDPASSPAATVNEIPPSPSGANVGTAPGKATGKRSPKDGPGSPDPGKVNKKAKTAAPAAKKKAPAKGKKASPSPSPKN